MTTFTDDFNRANGAPGAGWVDATGLWTIVSNQLSPGTAGGTIVIRAATAMATNDNSAQIAIAATGAVSHGVFCRGNTGFTSGYLWRNDGTSWNLFSNVGGSFTSLGSFAGAAAAGDVAKITAVGSTITGYVNGVARVTVTNTAVTAGTSVGLRAESSSLLRFDDFTGADVTSGVSGDAALSSTATLSASGLRATAGSSALAAAATLSTTGLHATAGAGSVTSTASMAADGVRATAADVSLPATATLAATGTVDHPGAAGLTASAALTAAGTRTAWADASLTAAASVAATGVAGCHADAALVLSVGLTAVGSVGSASGAGMAGTVGLQASGQVDGVVVRGAAKGAAGVSPRERRAEQAVPSARRGQPAVPVARGGAL